MGTRCRRMVRAMQAERERAFRATIYTTYRLFSEGWLNILYGRYLQGSRDRNAQNVLFPLKNL